jgi:hypothetical protein
VVGRTWIYSRISKEFNTSDVAISARAVLETAQRDAGLIPEGRPKNGTQENPFSRPPTLAEQVFHLGQ